MLSRLCTSSTQTFRFCHEASVSSGIAIGPHSHKIAEETSLSDQREFDAYLFRSLEIVITGIIHASQILFLHLPIEG